jgi:hypothetical protein
MKPMRIWYGPTACLWFATCAKCGLMANGLSAASAYNNMVAMYKRAWAKANEDLKPTSTPANQAGFDRYPRC